MATPGNTDIQGARSIYDIPSDKIKPQSGMGVEPLDPETQRCC